MDEFFRITLAVLVLLVAPPLAADQDDPQDDEPKFAIDLESSSHVVRREEERLNFRYHTGTWDFEGLLASLTPRFRDDREQIGLLVARAFDWGELAAVVRLTDKPAGEDVVGGVSYQRAAGSSVTASSVFGAEATFAQADLADDPFLVGDDESQLFASAYWQRANGVEVKVFAASSATFDLMRGTRQLLERFPRSVMVGAETLADLYLDEGQLEDSAGVSIGFSGSRFKAHVYAKTGEQTMRGVLDGDDMVGFGGDFRFETPALKIDAELDLRQIDPADGFDSLERGRFFADLLYRSGRFEWGLGGYVQGESGTFSEIPDVYDTAGLGFSIARRLSSERKIGIWATWEDDAPDLQVMTRAAFVYHTAEREYGIGVRRDEVGPPNFEDETFGAFFTFKTPFQNLALVGDVGFQDSEVYGKLSIEFKKR